MFASSTTLIAGKTYYFNTGLDSDEKKNSGTYNVYLSLGYDSYEKVDIDTSKVQTLEIEKEYTYKANTDEDTFYEFTPGVSGKYAIRSTKTDNYFVLYDEQKNKLGYYYGSAYNGVTPDKNIDEAAANEPRFSRDYGELEFERFIARLSAGNKYYISIKNPEDFKFKLVAKSTEYADGLRYNERFYKIFDNASSYEEAEAYCKSIGGHLAIVNSKNKQLVLHEYFKKSAYIGLSKVDNTWKWEDGKTASYSNFASTNNNKNYVYIDYTDGKWYQDDWNSKYTSYICEWDDYTKVPSYCWREDKHYFVYYRNPVRFDVIGTSYGIGDIAKKATTTNDGKLIVDTCENCRTSYVVNVPKIKSIKLKTTSYKYDGKAKKPTVVVTNSSGQVLHKSYYTVKYSNNKNVGNATAKITFNGPFSGTKTLTYTIKPAGTAIKSLISGKKKITVKWKKQATQTSGYQIQYSTSSKFTASTSKTVTIKSKNTIAKTISSLKAKKKYYVRIRTYKTVSGKKYYSGWSKVLNVKTK